MKKQRGLDGLLEQVAPIVPPIHMRQFVPQHMLQLAVVRGLVYLCWQNDDRMAKPQDHRSAMRARNP